MREMINSSAKRSGQNHLANVADLPPTKPCLVSIDFLRTAFWAQQNNKSHFE